MKITNYVSFHYAAFAGLLLVPSMAKNAWHPAVKDTQIISF